MAEKINICNQALLLLGEPYIASFEEKTVSGRACATVYQTARNSVLTDIKPNFATKRSAELAASSTPPFEYVSAWGLPQDCEEVLSAWSGGSKFKEWRVEGSEILTNVSGVRVRYVSIAADLEARMQGVFVEALAAYVAVKLCYAITNARAKLPDMLSLYTMLSDKARTQYGQESGEQKADNSQLLLVR